MRNVGPAPEDLERLLNRGLEAISLGDTQGATRAFHAAIEGHPGSPEGYLNMGSLAQLQHDHSSAIEWYSLALNQKSDHTDALFCRALSEAALQQWEPARRDLDAVIKVEPARWDAYLNRGYILRMQGATSQAIEDWMQYLNQDAVDAELGKQVGIWLQEAEAEIQGQPLPPATRMQLAKHAYEQGDGATAMRHYRAILEITPQHRDARLAQAHLYIGMGKEDKGWETLHALRQDFPEDGELWYHIAIIARQQGDKEHAQEALHKARTYAPNMAEVYLELGHLAVSTDSLAALQWYEESLQKDPNNFEALNARGNIYHEQGQDMLAIQDFTRSLRLNSTQPHLYEAIEHIRRRFDEMVTNFPDQTRSYVARANLFRQLGRLGEALADWNRALNLDQENPLLITGRAKVLSEMGELHAAMADYTRAIELRPDQAGFYFERGKLYFQLSRYQAALNDLSQALAYSPEKGTYYLLRGTIYRHTDRLVQAEQDLNQAIFLDPHLAQAWQERAMVHLLQQHYPAALEDYRQAVFLEPDADLHQDCATVAMVMEAYELALHHLNEALSLNPNALSARTDRADILLKKGQWAAALHDLNQILAQEPHSREPWLMRAEAHYHLRNWNEVTSDASRAMVREPGQPRAYYWRGMGYYKMQAYEQAAKDLRRYLQLNPQTSEKQQILQILRETDEHQTSLKTHKRRWWSRS